MNDFTTGIRLFAGRYLSRNLHFSEGGLRQISKFSLLFSLIGICCLLLYLSGIPVFAAQETTNFTHLTLGSASGGFKPVDNKFLVSDVFTASDAWGNYDLMWADTGFASTYTLIIKADGSNLASFDVVNLDFRHYQDGDYNDSTDNISIAITGKKAGGGPDASTTINAIIPAAQTAATNLSPQGANFSSFTGINELVFDINANPSSYVSCICWCNITYDNAQAPVSNNAPSFNDGASTSLSVNEDASATSINDLLDITDTDTGDSLTWSPSSNPSKGSLGGFNATGTSNGGTVTPSGLTYTPTANQNGTDSFVIQVSDGTDTDSITIDVTITAVNDEPSVSLGSNQTVNSDAGPQSVSSFATPDMGPTDEDSSQSVLDYLISNDNNSLFSAQPDIDNGGTLTFTPASNADGTATVSVQVKDDGGIANGGDDTSQVANFTITVNDNEAPTVSSILRDDPDPTNATSVDFTVTFSESVTGVGTSDFSLTTTGSASGNIASDSGSGSSYTVTVDTITGDGTLRLDLVDDDTIVDGVSNPLGGSGAGNGNYTSGETYTIDNSYPSVSSILRDDPSPTNASSVDFSVTFSESVTGVGTSDFSLTTTGSTSGNVASTSGSGSSYTVTVDTITGDGTLRLDLVDDDTIVDGVSNPLGGSGAGNGNYTSGETYTIDNSYPSVSSILRDDPDPTNASSVDFSVTFSESVTGVGTSDFSLTTTGSASGNIASASGSGSSYTVTVDTITGDGTLRLDLVDDDTIVDGVSNPLGGSGAGNGNYTSGETYTIDNTDPTFNAAGSNPADDATSVASSTTFQLAFSEDIVKGTGDITLRNVTDGSDAQIFDISAAGAGTSPANGATSISGSTLYINPTDANLVGGKEYAIHIPSTAINDSSGNSFAGFTNDTTYNFTVQIDSDGDLTSAGGVTEPVGLPSTVDTEGEALDIFDFDLVDGGTSDGLTLDVSQIVLHTSGTGPFSQVTFRLNGPDASNVTGTYSGGANTLTFSSLSISVANGGSETYTVNAYYNDNTGLTEDQTLALSVDGDTDLTVGGSGTQMGSTSAVTNGSGSTVDITATQLVFSSQPSSPVNVGDNMGPVTLQGQDAAGNVDVDFDETVTLTDETQGTEDDGPGSLATTSMGGSLSVGASSGRVSWDNLTYDAVATINVQATSSSFNVESNNVTVQGSSGTVQFSSATYSVAESGGTATITVTRTGGSDGVASVSYATSDGTATQPSDYTAASGTLNWAAGNSDDKTFSVTINNDGSGESNETVNLTLSNFSGATEGGQSTATLTINDDDSVVTVSATDVSPTSTSPGTTDVPFVRLGVATDSGTADITSVGATLTGTAVDADISSFDVYGSNDDAFDSGEDTLLGSATFSSKAAEVSGLTFGVEQTPTKYLFLVLDIDADAVESHTAGLQVDQSDITVSGGTVNTFSVDTGGDTSLPVELSSFSATSTTKGVKLNWRTETEVNNIGFNVYRSDTKDGKYVKINAKLIMGAGTDATPHDYSFTDENMVKGSTYYYYIEDVGFTGKTNKSHVIEVTVGRQAKPVLLTPPKFALLQNFPNPFNPETWIPFQLPKDADVVLEIYNLNGQLVRTLSLGMLPAGYYDGQSTATYWDGRTDTGEKISSGIYFYRLTAGDYSAIKRMVVVK